MMAAGRERLPHFDAGCVWLAGPTRGGRNKLGQARPLIDTGQLRASISYEVLEWTAL
jgi:hypothetical protein